MGEGVNVNTIEEEHRHTLSDTLVTGSGASKVTEPTNFGKLNTEWDEYKQNRVSTVDEDPNWHQDGKDLLTIEDQ